MEKIKILLVDDKRENIFALEALLSSEKIEFHSALTGVSALELLLVHDFALAILDVQMPEMDGFELAELMRGAEATRAVPIIFVTAGAQNRQSTFRGYEKGAVDFLYKPLDPLVVKSKVAVFIELARQTQLLRHQLQVTQLALEERDAALETAKAALQTRDEFMTIASHELKTPITSLKLQLQMSRRRMDVKTGKMPTIEQLSQMFDVSNRQVSRLGELVEELLDISRIEAGRLELVPRSFSLNELIIEVTERFEETFIASKNLLEFDVEPGLTVEWDASRIEQVIVNLITNAAKYAPGTRVTLHARREGSDVFLFVKDEGPGVPKEKQAKIFERFERATNSRSISGLGIGLYIVSQIVEGHRGKIWLESEAGKGSRFCIRIPIQPFLG